MNQRTESAIAVLALQVMSNEPTPYGLTQEKAIEVIRGAVLRITSGEPGRLS